MTVPSNKCRAIPLSIFLAALCAAAFAQNTVPQTDPVKAYSTVGLAPGETLRLDVANIGVTNVVPPGPCNVQMGFVNAAGVLVKSSGVTVPAGHAVFLTLTFEEGSASTTAVDSRTRVNVRPVLNTSAFPPGPCRTVSSAEVFDAILGRTHLYAVPAEGITPSSAPPPAPDFGIVAITLLDSLRFNVTNITGSNGLPPGPCNVQMGFVNDAGDPVQVVAGTIAPGHTAFVTVNYSEAAAAAPSTNALARLNLRPLVSIPPGPCLVASSAELLDAITGETRVYILPAVQANIAPTSDGVSTNGQ
jgi:hypothetical protein